jgi:hypothetical protein
MVQVEIARAAGIAPPRSTRPALARSPRPEEESGKIIVASRPARIS